jgi:hypothetical protein
MVTWVCLIGPTACVALVRNRENPMRPEDRVIQSSGAKASNKERLIGGADINTTLYETLVNGPEMDSET